VVTTHRLAFNGPAIRRGGQWVRFGLRSGGLGLLLLAIAISTSCRGDKKGTLQDLNNIDALKARFNRDAGKPRIVLLLSPT
jgi:hypothetical protein